jgi:hypothetical protein
MMSTLQRNTVETIPPGLFLAIEPNQYSAIKHVKEIGTDIAKNHGEIAEIYLDTDLPFRCEDVAKDLVPVLYEKFPQVATKAVAYALRLLIPKKQRDKATSARRSDRLKERVDFTSEEWKAHCRKALEARNATGFVVDMNKAIIERGQVPWSEDEKIYTVLCAESVEFIRNNKPHWQKITDEINKYFHSGEKVRTIGGVSTQYSKIKKKKA